MLAPAVTGSGASLAESASTGAEVTVVVTAAPAIAAVSAQSTAYVPFVIVVPLASGLFARTTICTEPEAPAARLPMLHVTVPPASVPPAVADTNVVFAGTASVTTTAVAPPVPLLAYERV